MYIRPKVVNVRKSTSFFRHNIFETLVNIWYILVVPDLAADYDGGNDVSFLLLGVVVPN